MLIIFEKPSSLVVSETFFKRLEEKLNNNLLNGYYGTFNNCREQGLVLKIYENERELNIWACECRNSDQIMIVLGNQDNIDNNNNFDDWSWNQAKYFSYEDYDSAVDFVYKQIKYLFKDVLKRNNHFKFDTYKSIEDIRRIKLDAKDLEYKDYYELASFYDDDEKYSCSLIIEDGKMGLLYNLHNDNKIKRISFEECDVNLENEVALMLDMKEKLDKFIYDELEYSITMSPKIYI